MEIGSFKLSTGEELVAELVSVTGRGYLVKNPLVVHVLRGPQGEGQLAFAPWSLIQRKDVNIELLSTGLCADPVQVIDEVASSYLQQMTGLVLPPTTGKQIVLG